MTEVRGVLPGLLIVEDEKNTRDGLRRALDDRFDIYLAADSRAAIQILESESIDLMLCDLRLGADDGMDLLAKTQTTPKPPVCVMMTAYGSVDNAVEAMRRGAYDYVTKPLNLDKLEMLLVRALKSRLVETENRQLKQALDRKYGMERLIGRTAVMEQVFEKVQQVAPSRATILIEGESGTGKELVAQAIHQLSPRKERPMVPVHCAALSAQLLESELFGHEKGAFTGAMERRIGRFEEANNGTLFLDEIGEIDSPTQVKLLRALGERVIQRVGSSQPISVDVRLISATNKNLEELVEQKVFREDLFFRLNVVRFRLPPLRERKEDIPLLVTAFVKEMAKENSKKVTGLSPAAMDALRIHQWPGNIRELKTAIEHGVVLARGELIEVSDLPESVVSPKMGRSGTPEISANLNLAEMERQMITHALGVCHGNRTEAAERLGISRRTLQRKLIEFKLESL